MISETSKKWFLRIAFGLFFIALGVLLCGAAFFFWLKNYPNADDPKNIDYVLWKHGLNENMDLDAALRAMTHDKWPVRLVEGLSKHELEKRFGFIRTLDTAPHLRGCYSYELLRHPRANEVVALRESYWIVAFENGKAVDLLLCQGG